MTESNNTVLAVKSRSIHETICCNECNRAPIIGVRYKCQQCDDFDLCEQCICKGIHSEQKHTFKCSIILDTLLHNGVVDPCLVLSSSQQVSLPTSAVNYKVSVATLLFKLNKSTKREELLTKSKQVATFYQLSNMPFEQCALMFLWQQYEYDEFYEQEPTYCSNYKSIEQGAKRLLLVHYPEFCISSDLCNVIFNLTLANLLVIVN